MREALQDDSLVVELAARSCATRPSGCRRWQLSSLDDGLVQAAKIAHDVKSGAQMFGATRQAGWRR